MCINCCCFIYAWSASYVQCRLRAAQATCDASAGYMRRKCRLRAVQAMCDASAGYMRCSLRATQATCCAGYMRRRLRATQVHATCGASAGYMRHKCRLRAVQAIMFSLWPLLGANIDISFSAHKYWTGFNEIWGDNHCRQQMSRLHSQQNCNRARKLDTIEIWIDVKPVLLCSEWFHKFHSTYSGGIWLPIYSIKFIYNIAI